MEILNNQIVVAAVLLGLLSPFVIVGTGVVMGMTVAISKVMLGFVVGMLDIFGPQNDEEDY